MRDKGQGNPFTPGANFCPKCVAPRRPGASSCFTCGLDFQKFQPEEMAPPAWLQEKWLELWTDFDNKDKHSALLTQAHVSGEVTTLARLYKIAGTVKANSPWVPWALEKIRLLAMQNFDATMVTGETSVQLKKLRDRLLIAASILVLAMVAWALVRIFRAG